MPLPKGKGFVCAVLAWRDRRASGGGKSAGRGPPARPVRVTGQTGATQSAGEFGFCGRDARGFSPLSHGTDSRHLESCGAEFAGRSPPRDQYKFGRGRSFESQRGYGCKYLNEKGSGDFLSWYSYSSNETGVVFPWWFQV
jgi:hypothetical protein